MPGLLRGHRRRVTRRPGHPGRSIRATGGARGPSALADDLPGGDAAAVRTPVRPVPVDGRRGGAAARRREFAIPGAFGGRRGDREGGALALRWDDVDLDAASLRVRGTLARVNGSLVVTEPKTAKSRRTLPLSAGVISMLRAHRKAQVAERLRAGNVWTDTGHVFTTDSGLPMDPRNVLRALSTAAAKAGIADANVHTLRHSAATAMLDAGVHLKAVSELLGHADIRVTAEVYGHTSDEVARAAMDRLSAADGVAVGSSPRPDERGQPWCPENASDLRCCWWAILGSNQ